MRVALRFGCWERVDQKIMFRELSTPGEGSGMRTVRSTTGRNHIVKSGAFSLTVRGSVAVCGGVGGIALVRGHGCPVPCPYLKYKIC